MYSWNVKRILSIMNNLLTDKKSWMDVWTIEPCYIVVKHGYFSELHDHLLGNPVSVKK